MDINKILTTEFELVNKAFFEREAGINYLRVEVNLRKLDEIIVLSKKINEYLDLNDPSDNIYYLDIYSPGTDETFNPEDAAEHIGENVFIKLNKHVKDKVEFIGEILSYENEAIMLRWNAKGQFRKQILEIDNIELIKKYTKIKKK